MRLRLPVRHGDLGLSDEGFLFLGISDATGLGFMGPDVSCDETIVLVPLWAERTLEWFGVAVPDEEEGV